MALSYYWWGFSEICPFSSPRPWPLPSRPSPQSHTYVGLGVWHPSASFTGKKPPLLYLKFHFYFFNTSHLLFPPHPPLPLPCSLSPALLHTSLVVNDTITSSLHPQLTGIELKESVMTLLCVLPEWVSGNALPNINEANQTAAAATVSLHIYIYIYIDL